jgi:hypothetical protein
MRERGTGGDTWATAGLSAALLLGHGSGATPREAICDALGYEAARRGLDANQSPNDYGRELDALIEALGLDESA